MVGAVRSYAGACSHSIGATDFNNCSVIALSHAAGILYGVAHDIATAAGRKYGRGMNVVKLMDTALKHGIRHNGMKLGRGLTPDYTKPTVAQFAKKCRTGKFVVITREHALAVVNGTIYDNLRTMSKKKRVVAYWEITNVEVVE